MKYRIADSTADIEQCLRDIGCSEKTAEEFKAADTPVRMRILKKQRRALMDSVHENQQRVDRVDYIIEKMKNG